MSIEIRNLYYTYAPGTPYEALALDNVNLTIEQGEYVGIMGHTGCGKTTLMQLIAGLIMPQQGTILLDGSSFADKKQSRALRRKVGIVFQHPESQLFETTVARDVAFALKGMNLTAAKREARVREALALMGLDYDLVGELSPMGLSGGEKRRVAIAGVLAARPEILILDEPVAGLDPLAREEFLDRLDELHRRGVTILMVSHNADAIAEHVERVLVLEDGRLIADDRTQKVLTDEKLLSDGVGTCQIFEIAKLLRARGMELPEGIIRYEDLLDEVTRLAK